MNKSCRTSNVERLAEQLADAEEQAVHEHVDGENAAALLVRHQGIQPTLDDDGEPGRVDADQKTQHRQRRDAVGEIKAENRHRFHAREGGIGALETHRRDHLVGIQAPRQKSQGFGGGDQSDHAVRHAHGGEAQRQQGAEKSRAEHEQRRADERRRNAPWNGGRRRRERCGMHGVHAGF